MDSFTEKDKTAGIYDTSLYQQTIIIQSKSLKKSNPKKPDY